MTKQNLLIGVAVATTLGVTAHALRSADAAQAKPGGPQDFLREGRCYRIAFTIDSASSYKVLEILEGGWIRAEVDAGSGQAQRQSFWANTAQMVTVRELRCSE